MTSISEKILYQRFINCNPPASDKTRGLDTMLDHLPDKTKVMFKFNGYVADYGD